MIDTLAVWHRAVQERDATLLDALVHENAVFHSPVVHTPQVGQAKVLMYLRAAFSVFFNDTFRYVREIAQGDHAMLEFMLEMDGILVNGVDIIHWDASGQIVDFKVMLRPLKGIQIIHQQMAAALQRGGPA